MKKMTCDCCGASINLTTMKCEYCGTQYKNEYDHMIRVETFKKPVSVFKSKIEIPNHFIEHFGVDSEEVSKQIINDLAHNLSEAIAPMMRIETEYYPMDRKQIITASIRVVEPDYRF